MIGNGCSIYFWEDSWLPSDTILVDFLGHDIPNDFLQAKIVEFCDDRGGWERTHRLGGWLFVAVGLIGILCSFIPALHPWGILVPIIAVSIFLYIYSYNCYQQQTKEGHEQLSPPYDNSDRG